MVGEGAGWLGKIRISRQRGQHLQKFRGKTEEPGEAHVILCGRCIGGHAGGWGWRMASPVWVRP